MISLLLFVVELGVGKGAGLRLTRKGAPQHLQSHAQRAIPALRDDSDITGHDRHGQLVHHWSVLVIVSKE